jgi:hypothetical protein
MQCSVITPCRTCGVPCHATDNVSCQIATGCWQLPPTTGVTQPVTYILTAPLVVRGGGVCTGILAVARRSGAFILQYAQHTAGHSRAAQQVSRYHQTSLKPQPVEMYTVCITHHHMACAPPWQSPWHNAFLLRILAWHAMLTISQWLPQQ